MRDTEFIGCFTLFENLVAFGVFHLEYNFSFGKGFHLRLRQRQRADVDGLPRLI